MERKFVRQEKGSFSNEEKRTLGELVERYKAEYDIALSSSQGKMKHDRRRGKWVTDLPKKDFVSKAVREFYADMKDKKFDDVGFKAACKLATRCFEKLSFLRDTSSCPPTKKRATGGGRKKCAPEVRDGLFSYFVDIRTSLKGRFPKRLLRLKAQQLYKDWLQQNPLPESESPLQFGNQWIKMWEQEYNISLRRPNKRCSIAFEDRKTRIKDYLQNIWSVRHYFLEKYGVDPPIINGDQMPLHRNESSDQRTLTFKNQDVFVKEKHMLSRERVTCFTTVSSSPEVAIPPEFVFKGKGTRTTIDAPCAAYQWSPSGSYRLDHLKKTLGHLPDRYNIFTERDFAIYVLDDYAVHLMPEVRQVLYQRGYILVVIGGGITSDVQVNDTHMHRPLKKHYRDEEAELMLQKLAADSSKIPTPDRSEMIEMTMKAWEKIEVDCVQAFKQNFVTNSFDGREDYLVSDRIFGLVGEEMQAFRQDLLAQPRPKTLREAVKKLIPPKGIVRKNVEGSELLDYMDDDGDDTIDPVESDSSEDEDINAAFSMEVNPPEAPHLDDSAVVDPAPTFVRLSGVCDDDEVNRDAEFLDQLGLLFETNDTSTLFLPHRTKLRSAYDEARRSLKRRINEKID